MKTLTTVFTTAGADPEPDKSNHHLHTLRSTILLHKSKNKPQNVPLLMITLHRFSVPMDSIKNLYFLCASTVPWLCCVQNHTSLKLQTPTDYKMGTFCNHQVHSESYQTQDTSLHCFIDFCHDFQK